MTKNNNSDDLLWPILYYDLDNLDRDRENLQQVYEFEILKETPLQTSQISLETEYEKLNNSEIEKEQAKQSIKNKQQIKQESNSNQDDKSTIINDLIRLARYPTIIERPYCEVTINGENLIVQILSKRGNEIKVKEGNAIKTYLIRDFERLVIL